MFVHEYHAQKQGEVEFVLTDGAGVGADEGKSVGDEVVVGSGDTVGGRLGENISRQIFHPDIVIEYSEYHTMLVDIDTASPSGPEVPS